MTIPTRVDLLCPECESEELEPITHADTWGWMEDGYRCKCGWSGTDPYTRESEPDTPEPPGDYA